MPVHYQEELQFGGHYWIGHFAVYGSRLDERFSEVFHIITGN